MRGILQARLRKRSDSEGLLGFSPKQSKIVEKTSATITIRKEETVKKLEDDS